MAKKFFNVTKYDKPILKNYKDVQKYDIIRIEYGDFDNWVNAIILDLKLINTIKVNEKYTRYVYEITFTYQYSPQIDVAYDNVCNKDLEVEVIGKAQELEKEEEM